MKRLITLVLAVAILATSAAAQTWQTQRGYRGFADLGAITLTGKWSGSGISVSTTHGYQLVPSYLFVGAGVAISGQSGTSTVPIYAALRSQLPTGKWSPFVDARIGYAGAINRGWSYGEGGFYTMPSVGVTWSVSRKVGLELAVGYIYNNVTVWKIEYFEPTIGTFNAHDRGNIGGMTVRLGVTF